MFEFEDISSGFHDAFLSKYADSAGTGPVPITDLYMSDSMQDMLDIDIRTDVATVVGGTNEFSSLVNDLPSLDIEFTLNDSDISWLGGPKWSATNDLYVDIGACVNPNSVMPIITSSLINASKAQVNLNTTYYRPSNSPPPSSKANKSHLTFSPYQIKVPPIQENKSHEQLQQLQQQQQQPQQQRHLTQFSASNKTASVDSVKKELIADFKKEYKSAVSKSPSISSPSTAVINNGMPAGNTIKLAPGIGALTFANSMSYTKLKQNSIKSTSSSALFNKNISLKKKKESSPLRHINSNTNNGNTSNNGNHSIISGNVNSQQNSNNKISSRSIQMQSKNDHSHNTSSGGNKLKMKTTGSKYPKPAFSYSCLIAMAFKNSRSGCLPVSDIYSFICEHFPYFETAPNIWKNSVRHNLSLNKCFGKIEKPTANGGQRKGCLWGMNPAKILKMDEEVRKWSRKDPVAIRNAMANPENLPALERGEMKHGSIGESDGENDIQSSDVEDNSDFEQKLDENLMDVQEALEDEDEEEPEKIFNIKGSCWKSGP